ncbi:hypothetical protein EES42_21950 [Streptomyces sp. ADI95-17]|nr:hypothetical protein EES42_21950 [Streptomyces sp. ADI95-17]
MHPPSPAIGHPHFRVRRTARTAAHEPAQKPLVDTPRLIEHDGSRPAPAATPHHPAPRPALPCRRRSAHVRTGGAGGMSPCGDRSVSDRCRAPTPNTGDGCRRRMPETDDLHEYRRHLRPHQKHSNRYSSIPVRGVPERSSESLPPPDFATADTADFAIARHGPGRPYPSPGIRPPGYSRPHPSASHEYLTVRRITGRKAGPARLTPAPRHPGVPAPCPRQYASRLPPSGAPLLASTSASSTVPTSGSHGASDAGARSQRTCPAPTSDGGTTR